MKTPMPPEACAAPPQMVDDTGRTTWIVANVLDVADGLLTQCMTAAAGIRRGEYRIVSQRIGTQSLANRWLIASHDHVGTLPDVRIVDDPVPMRTDDPDAIMELVARALTGVLMPDDDMLRATEALRAVVASESLVERRTMNGQSALYAATAAVWGPASTNLFNGGVMRTTARHMTFDQESRRSLPIGDAARGLPTCATVMFRDEPDHPHHIRLSPLSEICTRENAPDPIGMLRILADLQENPFP